MYAILVNYMVNYSLEFFSFVVSFCMTLVKLITFPLPLITIACKHCLTESALNTTIKNV